MRGWRRAADCSLHLFRRLRSQIFARFLDTRFRKLAASVSTDLAASKLKRGELKHEAKKVQAFVNDEVQV